MERSLTRLFELIHDMASSETKFKTVTIKHLLALQGGPDSVRQFLIINNQSMQRHTGKWESTFCCR
jgi:hypothetical protein